jgi:hypothetical protein
LPVPAASGYNAGESLTVGDATGVHGEHPEESSPNRAVPFAWASHFNTL